MKRLESIQHLRGIAALLVVFVHFPTPLARFCGSIGVDIFFFISGFIIFTSIDRGGYYDKPLTFLKKRLLRILPLYWVTTTLFILMHFVLNRIRTSTTSPTFDIVSIVKSYFFIPIENDGIYQDPVVFLGWSLNFEMLFYIIAFTLLLLFRKNFFVPLLIVLTSLGVTGYITGGFSSVYIDFLTSPFLLYFAVGVLLAKYYEKLLEKLFPFVEPLFLLVFMSLFVVMLGNDFEYAYTGIPREMIIYNGNLYPRIILWGIPAFLFFVSYFALCRKYKISNSFLNNLGDRSYSIYLLQIFFISFYYEIAYLLNDVSKIIISFILMALLIWFSGLSFKYFERRFHR